MKILFIGLERFHVRSGLRIVRQSFPQIQFEDLVACDTETAIELAAQSRDASYVFFLGYLMDESGLGGNFKLSVQLAEVLKSMLPNAIMVAGTDDDRTDEELVRDHCQAKLGDQSFARWLMNDLATRQS